MPQRYTGSGGWPASLAHVLDVARSRAADGSRVTSAIFAPGGTAPVRVFLSSPDGVRTRVYLHPDGTPIESSTGSSRDAMSVMLDIHRQLLGGGVGRVVVDVSTVVFVVVLLTGIPLWWPRALKHLRRSLSVRWRGAKAAGRIRDLHVSLGAWSAILLLGIGVTGVLFAYDDTQGVIYRLTGSERPLPAPTSGPALDREADVDAVVAHVREHSPEPESVFFVFASSDSAAVRALVFEKDAPHPSAFDTYYFDQYSGAPLGVLTHASLSSGERIRRALFPWHTGEWTLATKLLWGFVSLLGATFPVTGFLIWLRRRRRASDRRERSAPAARPAVGFAEGVKGLEGTHLSSGS